MKQKRSTYCYSAEDHDALSQARQLANLKTPQAKERTCLSCSKIFQSLSAGNRVCDACKLRQLEHELGLAIKADRRRKKREHDTD